METLSQLEAQAKQLRAAQYNASKYYTKSPKMAAAYWSNERALEALYKKIDQLRNGK